MRVRLDGYARAHASLRRSAIALTFTGLVALIIAAFFGMATVVALGSKAVDINAREYERWLIIGFLGVVTLVAVVPGTLLLRLGLAKIARIGRLRELSILARKQAVSCSADVARSLRLRPSEADGLVRDAATLGVIDTTAALVDPLAATLLEAPVGEGAQAGRVLNGTYRLGEPLGAGAMGAVYAARHLRTGRAYAVKLIQPDAHASAELLRRFQAEATAAGALGHPNIVGVHDLDATPDGVWYLVMDRLRGETLADRLQREGPLPFEEARRIALDIAAALEAAHSARLLHRDIKPSNIFLVQDPPRAVLIDFGLVKRLDEAEELRLTSTGASLGTPLYMSPEQARGEVLDVRSDLYGLGAVLYEMTTGAAPFVDRTIAGVYARLLSESAPRASLLRAVPPGVDALLDRALAKRKEERFHDVRAFAGELARINSGLSP